MGSFCDKHGYDNLDQRRCVKCKLLKECHSECDNMPIDGVIINGDFICSACCVPPAKPLVGIEPNPGPTVSELNSCIKNSIS